jgi:hypothetical protein
MHHAVPYGPRAASIKKSLAGLPMQLGLRVTEARAHVSKTHGIRAFMGLQDVLASSTFNACEMCGHAATVQLHYMHRYSTRRPDSTMPCCRPSAT